jgi:hypothetical protein
MGGVKRYEVKMEQEYVVKLMLVDQTQLDNWRWDV